MTANALWPISFGFVSSLIAVMAFILKMKNSSNEKEQISKINIILERHDTEIRDSEKSHIELKAEIRLINQSVLAMEKAQEKLSTCMSSIKKDIPKQIKSSVNEAISSKLKESVGDVFVSKIKEMRALIYGEGEDSKKGG